MALAPTFIGLWDPSRPGGSESRTESDDYHRNFAKTVQDSFPNVTGPVTSTHQDLNAVSGLNALGTKALPGVGGQTVVYFYLLTPPPGYAPVTPDGNVRNLTIGGTGATIGGADNPTNTPVNTSVTVSGVASNSTIPPGAISFTGTTGNPVGNINVSNSAPLAITVPNTTHVHPVSGSNNANVTVPGQAFTGTGSGTDTLTPRYAMGVLGQLNA